MFEVATEADDAEGKKRFAVSTTVGVAVFGTMIAVAVAVGGGVVREKKEKGPVEVKFKSVAKEQPKKKKPPPPPPPKKKIKKRKGRKKAPPPKAPVKITATELAEGSASDFNRSDNDMTSVTETGGEGGDGDGTTKVIPKTTPPPPPPPAPPKTAGHGVAKPRYIKDDYQAPNCTSPTVPTEYPKEAAQKGIEGTVVIKVDVQASGELSNVRVVSGPKELVPTALAVVKQITCTPAKLDGEPTGAVRQFTIPFKLMK